MNRRHIRGWRKLFTHCGHRVTEGEWNRMTIRWLDVNCKRCLTMRKKYAGAYSEPVPEKGYTDDSPEA